MGAKPSKTQKRVTISNALHRSENIEIDPGKSVPTSESHLARRNVKRQFLKYGFPIELSKDSNILAYIAELEEQERKLGISHPTETLGKLLTKYGKSGNITLNNVKNVIDRATSDRRLGLHRSGKANNLLKLTVTGLHGGARHTKTRKRRQD